MQACPALDAAVIDEGDDVIVPLVEPLAAGAPIDLPGVLIRVLIRVLTHGPDGAVVEGPPTARVTDANALPILDCSDYYRDPPASLGRDLPYSIALEASRGCWRGPSASARSAAQAPPRRPISQRTRIAFARGGGLGG